MPNQTNGSGLACLENKSPRHAMSVAQERLPEWESAVSAALFPTSLALANRERAGLPRMSARFRRVSRLRFAGLSVVGVAAVSRLGSGNTEDCLKILFVTKGRSRMWRDGVAMTLAAGTWTVYDPASPYRIEPVGHYDCVAVAMPGGAASGARRLADEVAGRVYPTRGNMLLALQAISLCLDETVDGDLEELAAAAQAITTLIESGIKRSTGVQVVTNGLRPESSLLSRVEAHILTHSASPEFSVAHLADALQVSRRTLYNVLKPLAKTPYKAIQQYRLEASSRALTDPGQRHKSVTEVALEAGFPDVTHFARLFKRHFGVTPTTYRSGGADS